MNLSAQSLATKNIIVPIVILHRNEFSSLNAMLDSIEKNTKFPHKIFVVDNNSSRNDAQDQLSMVEANRKVTLIKSKKNNWLLGFNAALSHPDWPTESQYYVFSDADIVLPNFEFEKKCWLGYLVDQMSKYSCIGKLGISLETNGIDNEILKMDVIKQRAKFDSNPRIGENIIAPVDTTLAIYRNDLFVDKKFQFSIGHASLVRPYYYTCRTSEILEAKHLGWYNEFKLSLDDVALKEKIQCFAKFGAYIEPSVLKRCSWFDQLYYRVVHSLAIGYWGSLVLIKNATYLIRNFPRKINQLQFRCR